MQTKSTTLLSKISELLNSAAVHPDEFPDLLCEFIAAELGFSALVLFRTGEKNSLTVLGKSHMANQIFGRGSEHICARCSLFSGDTDFSYSAKEECDLQVGSPDTFEACTVLKIDKNDKIFLKISKDSPFNAEDRKNLEAFSGTIKYLLKSPVGGSTAGGMNLSRMIADIAHELRSPTNSIMGFASLLNEDSLTPGCRRSIYRVGRWPVMPKMPCRCIPINR